MTIGFHLPHGGGLEERRWHVHHRLLMLMLAAQVPALLAIAFAQGRSPWTMGAVMTVLMAALLTGHFLSSRLVAMLAVALGMVSTSAVVVWLTDGAVESRLHVFGVLGFLALYRDWPLYLSAVGGAGITQIGVGLAASGWHVGDQPGRSALVPGVFVLAAAASHVLWWWASDPARDAGPGDLGEDLTGPGDEERALMAHLGEAERLKSELVAIVSHEFRTPLTSIMGFAQTLEQRIDQMDRRTMMTCLRSIEHQARRLERIVTNLLVASAEVTSTPDQIARLTPVAAAVLQELEEFPGRGGHRVVADIESGLGARMSSEAAARILTNLLDNALKFAAPNTEIRLAARRAGELAVLEVANQGAPIHEDDLERIFHPFVQADSSDTRRAEGIGLGLAIVRRLAEAHGGRVEARNDEPWVTLVVSLPAAEAPPDPAACPRDPVGARTG
ncbi:MAG: GHKL domain-containing protein [Nitriliruptorales bacterium]|nr:GHKL domain-containing protein [Nitriliruptorales bacterium]